MVVLAAGRGSRFGAAAKLLAELHGRPVLQHVLDAAAQVEPSVTVVVLGDQAAAAEAAIRWRTERRVVNPRPGRGLSSSVRLGLATLDDAASHPTGSAVELMAALILLGDQPHVSVPVLRALLGAPLHRPIVVPRYAEGGGPNPVLLRRPAWSLTAALDGDRGFGPLIALHSGSVMEIPVPGSNPDIDTLADLQALEAGAAD